MRSEDVELGAKVIAFDPDRKTRRGVVQNVIYQGGGLPPIIGVQIEGNDFNRNFYASQLEVDGTDAVEGVKSED